MTKRSPLALAIAAAALVMGTQSTSTQEARKSETCINVSRVERMEIVDEQTLLFYLPGGSVYRNKLRDRCPNIDRTNNPVTYQVTASRLARLCANELLSTTQGQTCRLGAFEPISGEEAEYLLTGNRGSAIPPITSDDVTPAPAGSRNDAQAGSAERQR